jgi:hypothetical protein
VPGNVPKEDPDMRKIIPFICALAALAIPATAAASGANSSAQKHELKMYKVEKFVSIDAIDYDSEIMLACNGDDIAVDGMWRVDRVHYNEQIHDFPFNEYDSVTVFRSFSSDEGEWTFGVRNDTEEPAQVKLWITCLGRWTESAEGDSHKHQFTVSSLRTHDDVLAEDSVTELDAGDETCAGDELAVATGFDVEGAAAVKLYKVWPADPHARGWKLGFYAPEDPKVTTSVRCLQSRTSKAGVKNHRHAFRWRLAQFTTSLSKDYHHTPKQDCGEVEKALIGAFDIRGSYSWGAGFDSHWLWYLGMEPQLKSRVFHVWNHSDTTAYNAKFGAICFNDKTGNRIL